MGYPSDADFEEAARGPIVTETPLSTLMHRAHQIATSKGFWEKDGGDIQAIALMHSELSEALEGIRHGNPPSDHIPTFSSVEEEFADVCIRIFDTCQKRGYRLMEAIEAKMQYNEGREYMHGGKTC